MLQLSPDQQVVKVVRERAFRDAGKHASPLFARGRFGVDDCGIGRVW